MEDIIRKASRFTLIFTSLLLILFLFIDLGLLGEGVRITGFYYIFMGVFLIASLWAFKNSNRFKGF